MCGVDDELAFDLEIGGHAYCWIREWLYSFYRELQIPIHHSFLSNVLVPCTQH
jgi:hypothetical protein